MNKSAAYHLIAFFFSALTYFLLSLNLVLGFVFFILVFFFLMERTKIFFSFFVQIIFFQNTFIGFFSGFFESSNHFKVAHGINILAPILLFVMHLIREKIHIKKLNFLNMSLVLFVILSLYFLFGSYLYGFQNAAAYLRLFSAPVLMLFAGLYFSKRLDAAYFNAGLKLMLVVCAIVATFQIVFPKQTGILLNELAYYRMKSDITDWNELLAHYGNWKLFNLPWLDINGIRVGSLIKSVISLGYFLMVLGIYFYWPKRKWSMLWLVFILVLAVNSKGVLLSFLFVTLLYFFIKKTNLSKTVAICSYLVLTAIIVLIGYKNHNEHILGFVNGVKYLLSAGNGLGFSGNLSSVRLTSWSGGALPDLGYFTRFQNGSESVFGILFSSMGIFSVLYLAYFLTVIYIINAKRSQDGDRMDILKVLAIVLFVQGIFQEEAFSPYALGLGMFLVGFNYRMDNKNKDFEAKTHLGKTIV